MDIKHDGQKNRLYLDKIRNSATKDWKNLTDRK